VGGSGSRPECSETHQQRTVSLHWLGHPTRHVTVWHLPRDLWVSNEPLSDVACLLAMPYAGVGGWSVFELPHRLLVGRTYTCRPSKIQSRGTDKPLGAQRGSRNPRYSLPTPTRALASQARSPHARAVSAIMVGLSTSFPLTTPLSPPPGPPAARDGRPINVTRPGPQLTNAFSIGQKSNAPSSSPPAPTRICRTGSRYLLGSREIRLGRWTGSR